MCSLALPSLKTHGGPAHTATGVAHTPWIMQRGSPAVETGVPSRPAGDTVASSSVPTVSVTLDPQSASGYLQLSEDWKCVTYSGLYQGINQWFPFQHLLYVVGDLEWKLGNLPLPNNPFLTFVSL